MSLTTSANVKEKLGISGSGDDALIANDILRADALIDSVLNRTIEQATFTEYYDGTGTKYLDLREGPISSVTSVSTITYDTAGNETATALNAGDYFVHGDETSWLLPGWLESNGSVFCTGQRNYKVVYVAGFATVPSDIEAAALHCIIWWRNKRTDTASESHDAGQGLRSFRGEQELIEDLRRMLAPYMRL